jgi:pimeloyl-ACP methyl ester carboxylesterase
VNHRSDAVLLLSGILSAGQAHSRLVELDRQTTVAAGARLPEFAKPALVAWSADDAFFPLEDGRRLAAALPDARLEVIPRARTFSMIDRPDVLAELIAAFAGAGKPGRAA